MKRPELTTPAAVEPLALDPTCACLLCRTGHGDCFAIYRLVHRLVEVVAAARTKLLSDRNVVDEMRRRSRRSELAPLLVELVLRGAPGEPSEEPPGRRAPSPAEQWLRGHLQDESSRLQVLEAVVDVLTELSSLSRDTSGGE